MNPTYYPSLKIIAKAMVFSWMFLLPQLSSAQFFPGAPVVTAEILGPVAPGNILISPLAVADSTGLNSSLYVLDSVGNPLVYIPLNVPFGLLSANLMLQPNGLMSFNQEVNSSHSRNYLLDSTFTIVDTLVCGNGLNTGVHEVLIQPNGNTLLKCKKDTIMDLSALTTANGNPGDVAATVRQEMIQLLDPNKTVLWQWNSLDHFDVNDTYSAYFKLPTYLDHAHYNALEVAKDGNYLISNRNLNEITKISAGTGKTIWRLGGKNNQFTLLGDTVFFSGQHDIRMLANGNLTLFDNSLFSPNQARAVEYEIDTIAMTAELVWEHRNTHGLFSQFVGNVQQLDNGNRIVNWGGLFPLNLTTTFVEIDAFGNDMLKVDLSDGFVTYRARKYHLPFTIKRPKITCLDVGELVADSGYASYYWSNGDTTQRIVIGDTGTYEVWCNYGMGYVTSKNYRVTTLDNPCLVDGLVSQAEPIPLRLFPNPTQYQITIENSSNLQLNELLILDISGRVMKAVVINNNLFHNRIDVADLPTGIYLLRSETSRLKFAIVR
jgi:hypothetical protein